MVNARPHLVNGMTPKQDEALKRGWEMAKALELIEAHCRTLHDSTLETLLGLAEHIREEYLEAYYAAAAEADQAEKLGEAASAPVVSQ